MTTPNDVIVDLRKLEFCSTYAVKTFGRLKFIFENCHVQ